MSLDERVRCRWCKRRVWPNSRDGHERFCLKELRRKAVEGVRSFALSVRKWAVRESSNGIHAGIAAMMKERDDARLKRNLRVLAFLNGGRR